MSKKSGQIRAHWAMNVGRQDNDVAISAWNHAATWGFQCRKSSSDEESCACMRTSRRSIQARLQNLNSAALSCGFLLTRLCAAGLEVLQCRLWRSVVEKVLQAGGTGIVPSDFLLRVVWKVPRSWNPLLSLTEAPWTKFYPNQTAYLLCVKIFPSKPIVESPFRHDWISLNFILTSVLGVWYVVLLSLLWQVCVKLS